jgi:hypothetical protein
MRRMPIFRVTALAVCLAVSVGAQAPVSVSTAAASQQVVNTWSARSAGGMVLMGTFTAVGDTISGFVTGTWTLNGAQGATLAEGGWSASKSPTGWSGEWRSIVAGSAREYIGTWTATTTRRATASLPQLFAKKAVEQVINGRWRSSGNSGAWSIRLAADTR